MIIATTLPSLNIFAVMMSEKKGHTKIAANLSIGDRRGVSQSLANPLADLSPKELASYAGEFCAEHDITEDGDVRAFCLGAQIAGSERGWRSVEGLTGGEKAVLEREEESKWTNPKVLYLIVFSKFVP